MNTTLVAEQLKKVLEDFRAGNFDSAAVLLDGILAVSVPNPELLHLGAMIALRRRQPDVAEGHAVRAVAACPDSAAFRYTRAMALSALRRYDEALAELRNVLQIDAGYHKAHVRIWEIMGTRGEIAEATKLVKHRLEVLDGVGAVEHETPKVRIRDTTLCCIDCSNYGLAIRALRLSLAGCEFPRTMLLTDRRFDLAPIETVIIDSIRSLQEYSEFVIRRLFHYVDTEYVLLIQWDGYVVDPGRWSDEFLLFDYVGARWPHEALHIPAEQAIGNGGFSLRSRTLLKALQDPRIARIHPEDEAICLTYRRYLEEQHGIAFAPSAIADRFSFEHLSPVEPTFGFHGQINITRFVDDAAIRLLKVA